MDRKNLSAQNASAVKQLCISPNFDWNEKPMYDGRMDSMKTVTAVFGGGAIGGMMAAAASSGDRREIFAALLKENGISAEEITRATAAKMLNQQGPFNGKVATSGCDYTFTVRKGSDGISPIYGFINSYGVVLSGTARITDSSGQVIWERYKFVTPLTDNVERHKEEEFFKNPELLRKAYEQAAGMVVGDWISSM